MTIQNQLKLIPLSKIKVNRNERQRSALSPASVFDLACSIAKNGLLQNIGIAAETKKIIFGERRFTAVILLLTAVSDQETGSPNALSQLTNIQSDLLIQLARQDPQYNNWTSIPARLIKGSNKIEHSALEFIENASRSDLPWQDKAQAAYSIHKTAIAGVRQRNADRAENQDLERWSDQRTAELLGITRPYFTQLVAPLRELESSSKSTKTKVKEALKQSATPKSALNASRTIKERFGEHCTTGDPMKRLAGGLLKKKRQTKPASDPLENKSCPIFHADFHNWAGIYTGPAFNFIHCDFPYGIEFNQSTGNHSSPATRQIGNYDDSEEVLWSLLETLAKHKEKLIAPSAHIMFWFTQKLRRKIEDFFIENILPASGTIQDYMLIWHISDNLGLLPAPQYEGRRTYETALQISIGKRKIAHAKALSFAHPKREIRIHRSQKPLSVLNHFFSMFVDESSLVLDPTCGSGTSIIAAKQAGAKRVVGLEIDEEAYKLATKYYRSSC